MIKSIFHLRDNLDHLTEEIELLGAAAVEAGAREAGRVAQESSTIDLQIEIIGPVALGDGGYAAGAESRKRGSSSDVRIAPIFDGGSLGKRRRKLATNRSRRESWEVTRQGTTYTAQRHEIDSSMGIKPQNFFAKGRRAGDVAIVAKLRRGL